jgi:uncharacterized delta-60 repeat protein
MRIPRSPRAVITLVAGVSVLLAGTSPAAGLPGQVVGSFGPYGNGTVRRAADVAVLPASDGKIVTVGSGDNTIVVSRQAKNGRLDHTFAHSGTSTQVFGTGTSASAAVLQPDGKVVVAGTTNGFSDFLLMRFTTAGESDEATASFPQRTDLGGVDEAYAVAVAPDGRIVVAGRHDDDIAVVRYRADGTLDPTFGGDGVVTTALAGAAVARAVAVQANGKVVVAGTVGAATEQLVLVRYHTNGHIDRSFGANGFARQSSTPIRSADQLVLQGDDLLVGGEIALDTFGLSRFDAGGEIDRSFGLDGTQRLRVAPFTRVHDLTLDAHDRILAIGQYALSTDFPDVRSFALLARFTANGRRDTTFGCGGIVATEVFGAGRGHTYQSATATAGAVSGRDVYVGMLAARTSTSDLPPFDRLLARYKNEGGDTSAGYVLARADGGTSAFGSAPACGSVAGRSVSAPIVGIANDEAASGSWAVARDGGVFAFGSARFLGSMGGVRLHSPVVGIAAAPDGNGYWLAAADGGVFAFGSARFRGSMGGTRLVSPTVGLAAAPDGNGYWLAAADGGVFAFGSARFRGSTGDRRLSSPVVGIGRDADGDGYWLTAADGGVFAFAAPFLGSTGASSIMPGAPNSVVGIAPAG